jgi:hypothetical protein
MTLERDTKSGRFQKLENKPEPVPTVLPEEIKPSELDSFSKELVNETAPIVTVPIPKETVVTPSPAPITETPTPVVKPSGSSGFGSILAGVALALVAGAAALVLGKSNAAPAPDNRVVNVPVQAAPSGKRYL